MTGGALPPLAAAQPQALRSLKLDGIKLSWSARGEEELPTWLSARLDIDSQGRAGGRVVELSQKQDGADEDGDPAGLDAQVYETADATLKDVRLSERAFTFTVIYDGPRHGEIAFVGRLDEAATPMWEINALGRGADGASSARNRFPLWSELKDGALEIYDDTEAPDPQASQEL